MKQKNLILIPFWIEKVLKRNQLPVSTILDYNKLRSLMSLSDLSAFLHFQIYDKLFIFDDENITLLSSWEQTCQENERVELVSTVVPLSLKEESKNYIFESMNNSNEIRYSKPYNVIDLDRGYYSVVIYPGFQGYINTKENKVQFIEDLIKVLYNYMSNEEVAQQKLFLHYVDSLRKLIV